MQELVIELLRELVGTPSVNPLFGGSEGKPVGEELIVERLETRLRSFGLETWVVDSDEPRRPSVVACLRGSGGGRSLMFNGHLDTVGVDDYSDPFEPRIEGDRLYGRGSYDMKGGLAACVAAIASLAMSGERLQGDVWVSGVADEEAASLGARAVARQFPTDGVVVAEPTDLTLKVAHKGFLWLRVRTEGFACHGSEHRRGVDANRRMAPVLRALDQLEAERSSLRHDLLGAPSLHVGRIDGGVGPSIYSASCTATVELRTLPGERTSTLTDRLAALIAAEWPHGEASLPTVELALERPSLETPVEGPLASCLSEILQTRSLDPAPQGIAFWTDAAVFDAHSPEALLFGPRGDGAHQTQEWVEISTVVETTEVFCELARRFCESERRPR